MHALTVLSLWVATYAAMTQPSAMIVWPTKGDRFVSLYEII